MCDNVIDIILCKLYLESLANISDTNNCLRNIASPVFAQKYGKLVLSFDALPYSCELLEPFERHQYKGHEFIIWRDKPLIRIGVAKIWFKLLRNFGKYINFIRIQCDQDKSNDIKMKIPYALWNLMKYILKYCANSLEILDSFDYPFLTLNKRLAKLHTFNAQSGFRYGNNAVWKHWNTNALELMPNLRVLKLFCVSIIIGIRKTFSKIETNRPGCKDMKRCIRFFLFCIWIHRSLIWI